MKIGDKVKFLNEIGGGRVSGFQGKNVVLVEDADGFEVPMQISEVVVVGDSDRYDTTHMVEVKKAANVEKKEPIKEKNEVSSERKVKRVPDERPGGDMLSAYIAFVPIDVKELSQTRFEAYLVNDSNYFLRYAYASAEGKGWHLRNSGEVEPNTKEYLEEFGREELNELERLSVQMVAYKNDRPFLLKPAIDVQLRIDPVKFYKLHTFQENDFFEQPSLIYPIIENDRPARTLALDAQQLKEQLYKNK